MIKFLVTLTFGACIGAFVTVQYQGSVNRTLAHANRVSNSVSNGLSARK